MGAPVAVTLNSCCTLAARGPEKVSGNGATTKALTLTPSQCATRKLFKYSGYGCQAGEGFMQEKLTRARLARPQRVRSPLPPPPGSGGPPPPPGRHRPARHRARSGRRCRHCLPRPARWQASAAASGTAMSGCILQTT